MCDFCGQGFNILNKTMEYSGLEIALMRCKQGAALRVRYFPEHCYSATPFKTQDIIVIDFCPKCGRKLRTEDPA